MKIPKSFRVNGKKWSVIYKWGLKDDRGELLYGMNDPETKTVLLDRGASKAMKKRAYIHEHLHAIFVENDLRSVISHDAEELAVSRIEEWVCELLGVEDE